jgi:hypothetical protein
MLTVDDLKEVFVDESHKRASITPACEKFYMELTANKEGLVSLTSIGEWAQQRGYIFPSTVQWMRMLWKAGKVRRFVNNTKDGWYSKETKHRRPYFVHYLICKQ